MFCLCLLICVCLLLAVHVLLACVREESSDESEDEMEVEGAAPTPSTSRGAKHDIIIKQEVRNVFSSITEYHKMSHHVCAACITRLEIL